MSTIMPNLPRHLATLVGLSALAAAAAFPPVNVGPGVLRHSDQDNCDPPDDFRPTTADGFSAEPFRRQRVIYVNHAATGANTGYCWRDAFPDLQDALDQARGLPHDRVEIWVARGTYRPDRGTANRMTSFELVDGVAVFGGFLGTETRVRERDRNPVTNQTILSGDLLGDDISTNSKVDNAYHVVTGENLSRATILDGFQVVGGLADGVTGPNNNHAVGGGLRLVNANPRVRWVLFYDNLAYGGGAIHALDSDPRLRYVGFLQNGALDGGAILAHGNSDLLVEFGNIWDNIAVADGGGILLDDSAALVLLQSRVLNNDAVNGGGVLLRGAAEMQAVSTIFSGNVASEAGGAIATKGVHTLDLTNATVASNSAATGGGISTVATYATIRNSILWNNIALDTGTTERAQFDADDATLVTFSFTCLQGWSGTLGGNTNTGADPMFVNDDGTLATDLRLAAGSPLIDAGNNAYLHNLIILGRGLADPAAIALDVNEETRIVDDPASHNSGSGTPGDPLVDIGAAEYQPAVGDVEPTSDG